MDKYLRIFLRTAVTIFLGISVVNLLVDPYRLFRVSSWSGINRVKPYASHEEWLGKAYLSEWVRAKSLILGNSRAEIGLDPAHPSWPTRPVLNLAVAGTALAQSAAYLRHASAFEKPELVVLGVDFMDFRVAAGKPSPHVPKSAHSGADTGYSLASYPDGQPNAYYTWNKWKNRFSKTVSLDAFWHTLGTLYYQQYPYAEDLTELGFNPLRDYIEIVRTEGYAMTFKQRDAENSRAYAQGAKEIFVSGRRGSPVFDTFRDIVDFCATRGIRLVVVIYPYHAHLLEIISAAGLWPKFEDWKRELATISDGAPAGNTTLRDFSGYNSFTTEPVPGENEKSREVRWYWEAGHFKKDLGDVILARMFDSSPPDNPVAKDFGVIVTSRNVEGHLADIRAQQSRYRSEHPAEAADLRALVSAR